MEQAVINAKIRFFDFLSYVQSLKSAELRNDSKEIVEYKSILYRIGAEYDEDLDVWRIEVSL